MKKVLLFFVTILVSTGLAFAQSRDIAGKVTDASTGEGIPFASIQVKGTMTGTSADAEGNYSIKVKSDDAVLVFVSVGYKQVEAAAAGKKIINVELPVDATALEETIVVAFGTSTKEAFTGSAAVVKSSDIAKVQSSEPTRALEGMVAGVQMTTSSGTLGTTPSIRIRGTSSISAGSSPLYVVDGVPYSGDLNNINSADIESMTVLKDAASNALYGARGANGVIMITTKKGKAGDAVVNIDAKWGWNTKALKTYDYITDPGEYYETHYKALYNSYLASGNSASDAWLKANNVLLNPDPDGGDGGLGYLVYTVPEGQSLIGTNGRLNPNATLGRMVNFKGTDYWMQPDNWMDEAYRQSLRQEYNISVSGTTGKASILASAGYLKNNGIIDNASMTRWTARLKTDYQAKSWLKVGGNVGYAKYNYTNSNGDEGESGSTGNIFAAATGIAPIYPVYIRDANKNIAYDSYGNRMYDYGDEDSGFGLTRPVLTNSNAISGVYLNKSYSEGNAVNATAYADVTFLRDFKFSLNGGMGLDESRGTEAVNKYYGQFADSGGYIYKSHTRSIYYNFQQLLSWGRSFGAHNVDVLLGHENFVQQAYSLSASKSQIYGLGNDELNAAVVDSKSAASSRSTYMNEGYFLRAQYNWNEKVFASASYRRDASSRFSPDYRWGNFWSASAAWLINKESWFNADWVDMLKLKASVGSQGNDNIGNYLYIDTYSIVNDNKNGIATIFNAKGTADITWETNTNFNTGVDFEFFDNRLSGSVEYFYRKTSDMLYYFTVPASLGYGGYYDNVGDMVNQGVEISLYGTPIQTKNFRWDIYANATHYKNKVTYIPEDKKTRTVEGYSGYASGNKFIGEGLPLYTFYLAKYAGVDRETGQSLWYKDVTDDEGNVKRETTSSYSAATQYLCDDPTPKLYGGFGTSFEFFGVDISASFTYSLGGLTYDSGYAALMASPTGDSTGGNFHRDILKAWTPENKDSDIPRFQLGDQYSASASDRFLVPASYLNFQNAQIGYTLPTRLTEKIKVSKLRFYITCDNICYWSYRQGLDPRYSFSGSTNDSVNSPVRTLSGGINITF